MFIRKRIFFYIILFISTWIYSLAYTVIDFDFWNKIAVGKVFSQIGHVLKQDIFSYTSSKPLWIDHEWGSGVVFYFLTHHFGDVGILLFKILGIFFIFFLLAKIIELQCTERDVHLNFLWYLLALFAMSNGIHSTIRAQLFTFIFFALWIYVLERVRRGENRLLWLLPITALVWANLHSGFIAGLGLLIIYGAGEFLNKKPFTKYFLMLIPCILIILINPYGIRYFEFLLNILTTNPSPMSEWLPTPLFGPIKIWLAFKLLLVLSIASIIIAAFKHKRTYADLDKVKYLLVIITTYFALGNIGYQSFFVIAASVFVYSDYYEAINYTRYFLVARFDKISSKRWQVLDLVKDVSIYTIIITYGSLIILHMPFRTQVPEDIYPVGAVDFIKLNNVSGNLLSPSKWGGYLTWNLYPNCLVAIDGRQENLYLHEVSALTGIFDYAESKNWYTFLDTYHTDILVLDKKLPAYTEISKKIFWKKIYDDKISAVFVPENNSKKSYRIPGFGTNRIVRNKYGSPINFGK